MANIDELNKQMANEKETARILKESLKIVDDLAKIDMEDYADYDNAEFDFEELEKLVKRAKELTKNRLWKLQ